MLVVNSDVDSHGSGEEEHDASHELVCKQTKTTHHDQYPKHSENKRGHAWNGAKPIRK